MPFDPLSVIGYVGTATGLIGFFVSTITRLEEFRREYKETNINLRWYQSRFTVCQSRLRAWKTFWCDGYSDTDRDILWGTDGHHIIKAELQQLYDDLNRLFICIYDAHNDWKLTELSGGHWKHWQAELDSPRGTLKWIDGTNISPWWEKLRFASVRGQQIKSYANRLKERIDQLEYHSNDIFSQAHSLPTTSIHNSNTVRKVFNRYQWIDETSSMMTLLHKELLAVGPWSLVLSRPDKEGEPDSVYGGSIRVEFDAMKFDHGGESLGIIPFFPCDHKKEDLRKWLAFAIHEAPHVVPHSRSAMLSTILTEARTTDASWKVELAEAAIGLVNWSLLLWRTPWTNSICTCQVRFVTLPPLTDTGKTLKLPTLGGIDHCQKGCGTHLDRKSLLLGIFLAELVLQQFIVVGIGEKAKPTFTIGNMEMNEKELLREVRRVGGWAYFHAVDHCIRYDEKLRTGQQFAAEHIMEFKEHVLASVQQYHDAAVDVIEDIKIRKSCFGMAPDASNLRIKNGLTPKLPEKSSKLETKSYEGFSHR